MNESSPYLELSDAIVDARRKAIDDPRHWGKIRTVSAYDIIISSLNPDASVQELSTLDSASITPILEKSLASLGLLDVCYTYSTALVLCDRSGISPVLPVLARRLDEFGMDRLGRFFSWRLRRAWRRHDYFTAAHIIDKASAS